MKGKNVNIYIREPIINKSKELIEARKLSNLINEFLEEHFEKEAQISKE
ncbi:MAG: hypothetical protein GBAus27B_000351 [Mycoplasmataceae bacterium]|nr:MAG: hypothetical protein GBAus27B_000351 [Mycoplasmataceae bacterium]